jgi:hypothetical protein
MKLFDKNIISSFLNISSIHRMATRRKTTKRRRTASRKRSTSRKTTTRRATKKRSTLACKSGKVPEGKRKRCVAPCKTGWTRKKGRCRENPDALPTEALVVTPKPNTAFRENRKNLFADLFGRANQTDPNKGFWNHLKTAKRDTYNPLKPFSFSSLNHKIGVQKEPAAAIQQIVKNASPKQIAAAVEAMPVVKAVEILKQASPKKQDQILQQLPPALSAKLSSPLKFFGPEPRRQEGEPKIKSKTLSAASALADVNDVGAFDFFGQAKNANIATNIKKNEKNLLYEQQKQKRNLEKADKNVFTPFKNEKQFLGKDFLGWEHYEPIESAVAKNNEKRQRQHSFRNKIAQRDRRSKSFSVSPNVAVDKLIAKPLLQDAYLYDDPHAVALNESKQKRRDLKKDEHYTAAKKICLLRWPNYKTTDRQIYKKCIQHELKP